jgi:GT2 family glycosyltransferase
MPVVPETTIVVATRDRATRLGATLQRLCDLPERPDVVVVDNGSRDGTPEVARGVDPRIRVVALGRNLGAVARNVGVAAARTPYVAFADDDSWWAPGALDRAAGHFRHHPRLALIAARALVGPAERLDPMARWMAAAPLGTDPDLPGPNVLGFLACATVVRREAFLAVGGFDPVVFVMGEESRVAYDLAAGGWGLAYCDDVVAHHHPSPGAADPTARRALALRNRVLTYWLRRPLTAALAETAALLRDDDPAARLAAGPLLARVPRALARRRAPHPGVERALARLDAEEGAAGYTPLPAVPARTPTPAAASSTR